MIINYVLQMVIAICEQLLDA